MKIYCKKCNRYLGEILTGSKLYKRIYHICWDCYNKLNSIKKKDDPMDMFGDIFKNKGGMF